MAKRRARVAASGVQATIDNPSRVDLILNPYGRSRWCWCTQCVEYLALSVVSKLKGCHGPMARARKR
jgi:hypothetical protein